METQEISQIHESEKRPKRRAVRPMVDLEADTDIDPVQQTDPTVVRLETWKKDTRTTPTPEGKQTPESTLLDTILHIQYPEEQNAMLAKQSMVELRALEERIDQLLKEHLTFVRSARRQPETPEILKEIIRLGDTHLQLEGLLQRTRTTQSSQEFTRLTGQNPDALLWMPSPAMAETIKTFSTEALQHFELYTTQQASDAINVQRQFQKGTTYAMSGMTDTYLQKGWIINVELFHRRRATPEPEQKATVAKVWSGERHPIPNINVPFLSHLETPTVFPAKGKADAAQKNKEASRATDQIRERAPVRTYDFFDQWHEFVQQLSAKNPPTSKHAFDERVINIIPQLALNLKNEAAEQYPKNYRKMIEWLEQQAVVARDSTRIPNIELRSFTEATERAIADIRAQEAKSETIVERQKKHESPTYTGAKLFTRLIDIAGLGPSNHGSLVTDVRLPLLLEKALRAHSTTPIRDVRTDIVLPVIQAYITSTIVEIEQHKPKTLFGRFKKFVTTTPSIEEERLAALRIVEQRLNK